MKTLNNFITEKLKLNKDTKISKEYEEDHTKLSKQQFFELLEKYNLKTDHDIRKLIDGTYDMTTIYSGDSRKENMGPGIIDYFPSIVIKINSKGFVDVGSWANNKFQMIINVSLNKKDDKEIYREDIDYDHEKHIIMYTKNNLKILQNILEENL